MSFIGSLLGFLPSLIGGIFGLGSSAINKKSQSNTNEANKELAAQQNEYNLELQNREFQQNSQQSELEYQRNLEKWQMENEYNTPSAQMQRYLDAGLNPNLIYGSGSASSGNASAAPQYTAARYSAPRAERATLSAPRFDFDPYQSLSIGNNLAIQKAQRDQISAQADFTRQQTKNAAIDNLIKTVSKSGLEFDLGLKRELRQVTIEQAHEALAKLSADKFKTFSDTEVNHARSQLIDRQIKMSADQQALLKQNLLNAQQSHNINEFKRELLKVGITDRDPYWARIISRLFLNRDELVDVLTK